MKKLLIALALGILLVLALATVASADNGPHGGFNGSTDACASCHRIHSAVSPDGMLLVANNIYNLCTSCHDGTGAYTNVVDGYFDTSVGDPGKNAFGTSGQGEADYGLFAGGFVNARMLTDYGNAANEGGLARPTANGAADMNLSLTSWARMNAYDNSTVAPTGRGVTSNHNIEGVPTDGHGVAGDGTGVVWGSGNFQASGVSPFGAISFDGSTADLTLECTSCHDPHGNAGRQGGLPTGAPYPSYRILRFTPNGSGGFETLNNATYTGTVGSGTTYNWNLSVVPSTAGVLVPDPTVKWYTPNTNATLDGTLLAYRGGVNSTEVARAMFAGRGDYGGIWWSYQRPAVVVSGATATSGTIYGCKNGAVLTVPATACGATSGSAFDNVLAQDKLGYWCATCHDRYLARGSASRSTDSTDPGYHYRHRSQGNSATKGQYTCVSCHNAHGTAATASTLAGNATYAAGATGSSVLLKADNRAICVRCHGPAVNFFNVTTSPTALMQILTYP